MIDLCLGLGLVECVVNPVVRNYLGTRGVGKDLRLQKCVELDMKKKKKIFLNDNENEIIIYKELQVVLSEAQPEVSK